jgi:exopolysaccharide biosynthesis polyprenyl glycosylphosphotransferase
LAARGAERAAGASPPEPSGTSRSAQRTAPVYASLGLLVADVVMVVLGYLAGYYLRFEASLFPYEEYQPLRAYLGSLLLQAMLMPAIFAASGLYRPVRSVSWLDQFYSVFAGVSVGTAVAIVVSAFLWRDAPFSRLTAALAWLVTVSLVMLGRTAVHKIGARLRAHGVGEERVIVVGSGETARLVLEHIRRSPQTGYRAIGFVAEEPGWSELDGLPVLGALDQVGAAVRQHQADSVIVAVPNLPPQQLLDIVSQCSSERISIKVYPDLFHLMTSGVSIGDLNGLPLVSVKDVALRGWNLALKRGMDLVVSAAALVVLSPLFLIVAAIIKLTSPGGAFHCQERVGLDGKPFLVVKFRTMRSDAEARTGPVWAVADDPRRTRIGAFLRRYSIDELPQLINVLIGEMSLVGPRPERPFFVEQFRLTVPRYFDRHREKAGITGWAQVNGLRGNTPIDERTAYDLWYVENWTLWLDIKILLRTPISALKGDNAY